MSSLVIRHATLIDGTGAPPRADVTVIVEDGRIRTIGGRSLAAPPGAIEIDASGHWLLPGFFDVHVHFLNEGPDLVGQLLKPPSYLAVTALDRMRRTLHAGVTTARDLGGTDRGIKMARDEGLIAGPRLQVAVRILSITGGHGDVSFAGSAATLHQGLMSELVDGDGVLAGVRRVIREGADVIKVCTTGGVLSPGDDPAHSHFSPEELEAIAGEARRQGRRLAAHAQGSEGIKNAVRAGWTTIEHGIYLDPEGIDLMLERGTFLVPTLAAPRAVLAAADQGLPVPPWALEKTRRVIDAHQENVARARAAGVKIALGTDSGVGFHGQNLHELTLLQEIGMSAMDAIVSGTRRGAEVMGLEDELGTVEEGKLADLVLTDADPLARLDALKDPDRIRLVIQDGHIVKDLRA
jgi:imidazolonepropionase-like amidohydrolase